MAEPTGEFEQGYTCKEVVELATDFTDGALTASKMARFEMHLNFCDGCFTFVNQIRAAAEVAGQLSEEQIPEDTKAKLLTAFRDWKAE